MTTYKCKKRENDNDCCTLTYGKIQSVKFVYTQIKTSYLNMFTLIV